MDGDATWVDDTTRFCDALAAALKILVNMASQAWCEHHIVTAGPPRKVYQQQSDDSVAQRKPQRLSQADLEDEGKVAAAVLVALTFRTDGKQALRNGGVKERFDDKKHPVLRYAEDICGVKADVWRTAVQTLSAQKVPVKHQDGSWKLGSEDSCKG